MDTITVERLDDLEVETVYRRIADLERGVRGFAVVVRVRLIRWTDIVNFPRFDTENESVPFLREPRRIPRPTVGGVEADSNPIFYVCLYLC